MLSPDWSEEPDTVPYAEFENPQTLNLYSYAPNKGPTVPANPCAYMGNAMPPSAYAAQGSTAKYNPVNFTLDASMGFPRGDFLDAQMGRSGWNVAAYGNYVFGVYMQAAGVPLGVALRGAEAYAATKTYPAGTPMAPGYPGLPSANAANISNGFNAQANGTTCHR
jgi:hypothetical protein